MTNNPTADESITGEPVPDDYDLVTSRDITELLHCLAHLHWGIHGGDTTERTAFLHRKAELFTRIADQHARRDPVYSAEVQQLALHARTAAVELQLPTKTAGPDHERTPDPPPTHAGARSQEAESSDRRNTRVVRSSCDGSWSTWSGAADVQA